MYLKNRNRNIQRQAVQIFKDGGVGLFKDGKVESSKDILNVLK